MHPVIILSGKAQSGKTSAMNHILSIEPNGEKVTFAEPLKEMCVNILGLKHHQCYGSNAQKEEFTHIQWKDIPIDESVKSQIIKSDPNFLTGREVLEVFGTQIFRRTYHNCWVSAAVNRIKGFGYRSDHIVKLSVIEDCRFPNEIDYLSEYLDNVHVIRLTRNPLNRQVESEMALDNYDFNKPNIHVIDNHNMNMQEKNEAVGRIVADILLFNGRGNA